MPKEIPDLTTPTSELSKKPEHISPVEEEVFHKLIPKLQELRINMDEFSETYSEADIQHDKESVRKKKERIEEHSTAPTKRARILEALLAEQIELSEWLGSDAMTIVPSEYDDLYNGVDLATEFQIDNTLQYFAMGVDVTSGPGSIDKKLNTIRDNLEKGRLTQIKYFTSDRRPDFHDRMPNIPSLVVGADARTINELASLWLTVDKSKNPDPKADTVAKEELREKAIEAQKKLARHRAQILILKQMEVQLEAFGKFAKNKGHKELTAKLDGLLVIIRGVLKTKNISKSDELANESDDVFRAIKNNLEKLF